MALVLSPQFDFRKTYFLFAGIAGVNPHYATVGSVAIARYAVQVALQYEIDPRSLPQDWPTGYISYGREYPLQYPSVVYGTEVFEVNENLQQAAFLLASKSNLNDQKGPQEYWSKYTGGGFGEAMATKAPRVVKCDIATSDVYYSGTKLAVAFENTTALWTNGSGIYCMSAQEENATLEVMVRAAIEGLVDFARIILVRAGSNFDRPPPGLSDWEHLRRPDKNGFMIAIDNLYNVGIDIVRGIVSDWNCSYQRGIEPTNYIGDIFGSLGGDPDFGFGSITQGRKVDPGGYNLDLAAAEMQRRKGFGLRAMLKQPWLWQDLTILFFLPDANSAVVILELNDPSKRHGHSVQPDYEALGPAKMSNEALSMT
ncbi:Purine nucleoside permease [Metarhizium album ARSEF 1941]|uniref:Purine nucleoside permease n=1 Tax=Metarhizium album (strain ARSEF 1941) TaxID=1081103 RepID=A0A0B2WP40_METAS|nr:Purine nucleoside permease [Metarhizium album ARSEF 1941]KHN95444.1 Purine nucleoside permease [Metarhizium album ARSEF 1941]